jgi:hypothetical protein
MRASTSKTPYQKWYAKRIIDDHIKHGSGFRIKDFASSPVIDAEILWVLDLLNGDDLHRYEIVDKAAESAGRILSVACIKIRKVPPPTKKVNDNDHRKRNTKSRRRIRLHHRL